MERFLFGSYQTIFRRGIIILGLLILWSCDDQLKLKSNKQVVIGDDSVELIRDEVKRKAIDRYFSTLHRQNAFNGNVLVSQHGKVIFKKSYGYSDLRTKDLLNEDAVFQLGSVSKQFTAVAVLQLYEQNKIALEDSIQVFFPDFPYKNISVHDLLCHRSGLMNYIYYCDGMPIDKTLPLNNSGVIQCLTDSFPNPYYPPRVRFDYSNTGYMLLASIVEKVSGLAFEDYMKKNVFEPLQMHHSYVYNHNKPYKSLNLVKGYEYRKIEANPDFLDGVVGDKGIYSTTYDLFLWDKGLYMGKIISKETLDLAFQAHGKASEFDKNYGYGWRMYHMPDSTKVIYHAGWWHGFQSLLVRLEKDTSTIVVLKNKRNKTVINQNHILRILNSNYNPEP